MITVRKARLKDIPRLRELVVEFIAHGEDLVAKEHGTDMEFIEKRKDAFDKIAEYHRKSIHSKNAAIFVAEHKETVIGYTLIVIKKSIPIFTVDRLGNVNDLFITERYRGLGASTLLKEEAFNWFRQKGISHLSIQADAFNHRAITIYKKWGFGEFMLDQRMKI